MLLFPQKDERVAATERTIYVLSARGEISAHLTKSLRMAGFNNIETLETSLQHAGNIALSANAWGVIIDINQQQNAEEVVLTVQTLVPRGIWCCVVGDSDSIALAQTFARSGIYYFNIHAQGEELIQAATNRVLTKNRRLTVSISILGCKGGIGNTIIAHQLTQRIAQIRKMPTLFIQGKSGSHDIDLLFDKKMAHELTPVSKHLDAMRWNETGFPQLEQDLYEKYNFVLFEDSVNAADKEQLRLTIERSSCVVLTMDRSMSSVRTVRQLIEIFDTISRSQQLPRRLLLCLSDSRPVSADMLHQEDIQTLLGRKIDVVFPWQTPSGKKLSSVLGRNRKKPLESLTELILGEDVRQKPARRRWISGKKQEA